MKKIVFILCSTLIVVSCNTKETNSGETTHDFGKDKTTLYLATINTPGPDEKQVKKLDELTPVKKDEIRSVTEDHFEISLNEVANGYMAQRNVTEPGSATGNSGIEYVSDWCGAITTFKTTAGFLSFMSARGYTLTSQTDNVHCKDYVFNKI
jgi:hypothetical protein